MTKAGLIKELSPFPNNMEVLINIGITVLTISSVDYAVGGVDGDKKRMVLLISEQKDKRSVATKLIREQKLVKK